MLSNSSKNFKTLYRNNCFKRLSIKQLLSTNIQVKLNKRPLGLINNNTFKIEKSELSKQLHDNDVKIKVNYISLDPAMRGWLNDARSYIKPVGIGEVMRALGTGTVIESNNDNYNVGDIVMGSLGAQEYSCLDSKQLKDVHKIDTTMGSETAWLNTLGMPGMTAYFGLKDIGQPKPGETIVVSAAAGAVGQTVGQLAKIYGLRVIGIAGGKEKCDWVKNELGYDACIDYKKFQSLRDQLKESCPNGIDIYFDNVGGDILDIILTKINKKARIIICGAISQYNNTTPIDGPKNYLSLLVNRARMEGMVVFDYKDRYSEAIIELSQYLNNNTIKNREHIVENINNFPDHLNLLFTGGNFGKLILKV